MLVGGARDTPGSAAAGVGVAAGEGAGSAVRVGSDSKESPISASYQWGFHNFPPKKGAKATPPPKKEQTKITGWVTVATSEQKQAITKVQFKSNPINRILELTDQSKKAKFESN